MPEIIRNNFTGGEVSPAVSLRSDVLNVQNGLRTCSNMIIRPQGGAYSRAGTRFLGSLPSGNIRLIPFVFNSDQTYILVFSNLEMRIVREGAFLSSGGSVIVVTTPYYAADLADIDYVQSADVMTLVHRGYTPRQVSRLAETTWRIDTIDYSPTVSVPTFSETSVTITALQTSGSGTAKSVLLSVLSLGDVEEGDVLLLEGVSGETAANGNYYPVVLVEPPDGGGLGNRITLSPVDTTTFADHTFGTATGGTATRVAARPVGSGGGDFSKDYLYLVTAVNPEGEESLPSAVQTVQQIDSLSTTYGVKLAWGDTGGLPLDYYRVYKDVSGDSGVFGWIGDSETRQFTDFNIAPITSDAPPSARDPLSGAGNYPGCTTYYQQRQIFANSDNEPQTIHATQTGNYYSFRQSTPIRDSDAFSFAVASSEVNEIRFLVSLNTLLIFTSGAEWRVTEGLNEVFTPTSVGVRVQSKNGCAKVKPAVINDSVIYVQDQGGRIRDLAYSFSNDSYGGTDLSIMAGHLFRGHSIVAMHYAREPDGVLWCLRDDGVLLGLTYQKENQVWAWHQHDVGGTVTSICSIPEGGQDALYASVTRVVNSASVQYLEVLRAQDLTDSTTPFCVDSGLSYSGSPTSSLTGLDHLEGETVKVLADGDVYETTVVSGGITLPREYSLIHVGLGFTPRITLLAPDIPSDRGSTRGSLKNIDGVALHVESSRGAWTRTVDESGGLAATAFEARPRDVYTDSYGPQELMTGRLECSLENDWRYGSSISVEQRDPLPLNILAVEFSVDVSR